MKKIVAIIILLTSLTSCNKEKTKWEKVATVVKESMEQNINQVDKVQTIYLSVIAKTDTAAKKYYAVSVLSNFLAKDGEPSVYQQTYYVAKEGVRDYYSYYGYSDILGGKFGENKELEQWANVQHVFKLSEFGKETFKRKAEKMLEYNY
jgi:hypothetical protein